MVERKQFSKRVKTMEIWKRDENGKKFVRNINTDYERRHQQYRRKISIVESCLIQNKKLNNYDSKSMKVKKNNMYFNSNNLQALIFKKYT